MKRNTKIIPTLTKKQTDMKKDYIAFFLEGWRDDVIIAKLADKYYLANSTVVEYINPRSLLKKQARQIKAQSKVKPQMIEYR